MSSLNNPLETSTNPINLIINKLPEKINNITIKE